MISPAYGRAVRGLILKKALHGGYYPCLHLQAREGDSVKVIWLGDGGAGS